MGTAAMVASSSIGATLPAVFSTAACSAGWLTGMPQWWAQLRGSCKRREISPITNGHRPPPSDRTRRRNRHPIHCGPPRVLAGSKYLLRMMSCLHYVRYFRKQSTTISGSTVMRDSWRTGLVSTGTPEALSRTTMGGMQCEFSGAPVLVCVLRLGRCRFFNDVVRVGRCPHFNERSLHSVHLSDRCIANCFRPGGFSIPVPPPFRTLNVCVCVCGDRSARPILPPPPPDRSSVLQIPRHIILREQQLRRRWWCSAQRSGLENDVRLMRAFCRDTAAVCALANLCAERVEEKPK